MNDDGSGFYINWVSVPIFLVLALAIALYARHVSGGWMRPWISIKPVWWFLILFLVPFVGVPLLVVNLIVHRHTPESSRAAKGWTEHPVVPRAVRSIRPNAGRSRTGRLPALGAA